MTWSGCTGLRGGSGDSGVPVQAVLAAAATSGLAGCRLARYAPAAPDAADLLFLALAGTADLHAAAVAGGDAVMWGAAVPLDGAGRDRHRRLVADLARNGDVT